MALISNEIPNLIGGVSQQPDSMRLINQCEAQENAISSPVEGLLKRPPTETIKKLLDNPAGDLFIHPVIRDSSEQYFIVCDGGNDANTIKVFDVDGNEKTLAHDTEGTAPETGYAYLTTTTPSTSLKAVTIADVTFIVNTEKTVGMGIADASTTTYEALVVVKQAPSNFSKCEITLKVNDDDAGLLDADAGDADFGYGSAVGGGIDAIATATRIRVALDGHTPSSGSLDLTSSDDTNHGKDTTTVYVSGNEAFSLTASDGLGGTIVQVIKDEVENFTDLPSVARHGMILKVIGNPETGVDDYYVKFIADNNQPGVSKGRWQETTGIGLENRFDYSTMPHLLIRDSNGDFKFTAADGSFGTSSAPTGIPNMGSYKFQERLVGDLLTNPHPSFVDSSISEVAFFKNRLVFLSGENIILSEVGEYFNFFRTTTAQLLDSDVIDVAVGGTTVSNLKHAIPFSNRLILFSDTSQFSLQGEQVLSPLNASVTSQTEFEVTETTKPVVSGSNLFFGFPRGSFNGVKQFFKVNEVDIQFDAVEISAQVPKYIQGNIKKFAASTHENMLLALTDTDKTSLYCFNYYEADSQRLVSSWSKFTFGADIYSMFFVDTTLYLIIKRGTELYIEKMRMETGLVDTGLSYMTKLDQRVYKATGTYSSATNKTTWSGFEYTPSASSQVMTNTGLSLQVTDRSAGSVSVSGDFSAVPVFIGEPYTMRYEMSKPIPKSSNWQGNQMMRPSISQQRTQLRYMTVVFADTAVFDVKVTPEYHDANTYTFTGRQLGDGSSAVDVVPFVDGDFKVPIFAQTDRVKIELINDSPLPSKFQAAIFEANQTSRRGMRLR